MFEHPTPRAIAVHLIGQVTDVQMGVAGVAGARSALTLAAMLARWPGGCDDKLSRWQMQCASGDAVREVPATRWTLDLAIDVGLLSEVQQRCVRHGGFIAGADQFDCLAFGISPAEASAMDPQQRLLLEHGYAALHDASLDRVALNGSLTGFFLGIASTDFAQVLPFTPAGSSVYSATGSSLSIAAGRVSYVLGLHGPCVSYDTACSAALVAGHAAVRAL